MIPHEEWVRYQFSTYVRYIQSRSKKNKAKKNRRKRK